MTPLKLKVGFSFFPYGGNGGSASEHPNIRTWFAKTINFCKNDERIDNEIVTVDYSDTPIPMMRNRSVVDARANGVDVLVMVDSDQHPDLYSGQAGADDFFPSSFDFLYQRKLQGKTTVIGAPYCGPPPNEAVYVFTWETFESNNPNPDGKLRMYSREEAALFSGIHPCAALPTGCIMFDMQLFDITDPKHEFHAMIREGISASKAKMLTKPWFYYEYEDIYQTAKASTEDVTATRDMIMCAWAKLGYNVQFVNWSAWAGHWKPKCVGKPVLVTADCMNEKFTHAARAGHCSQIFRPIVGGGSKKLMFLGENVSPKCDDSIGELVNTFVPPKA